MVDRFYQIKLERLDSVRSKIPDSLSKYKFIQVLTNPTNSNSLIISPDNISGTGITELTKKESTALSKRWHPKKVISGAGPGGEDIIQEEFDIKERFKNIKWQQ